MKALIVASNSLAEDVAWIVTTKKFKDGEGQTIAKFDSETGTWVEDIDQPIGAVCKKHNCLAVD